MQVNLSIQSFTHLFKQMFIEYLIGRREEEEEKNNVSVCLQWAVCGGGTER